MISAATTAITRHPVNLSATTSAVPTDMFPGIGRPDIFRLGFEWTHAAL
jgi:hypothetical protein